MSDRPAPEQPEIRTIQVDYLARVEGEGALTIRLAGREVLDVQLRIFEPPRFFEAFLRGRSQLEAPDITARICGICPVAYQMSACGAIEDAHGVRVGPAIRALRRLLYCGEWIESHALHVFMLHAPDFLGYPDALTMAQDHPVIVKRGLRMKKAGNAILAVLGGREIHPINVRVGGFYRAPDAPDLRALVPELRECRSLAEDTLEWLAGLSFPEFDGAYEFVALHHPDEYAITEGRLVSSAGLDIAVRDYDSHFEEQQVPHSTALHSTLRGRGAYFCGPLARVNLNFDQLAPITRQAARQAGFEVPCHNPFKGILARGLELLQAFDEAVAIIQGYARPARSAAAVPQASATGYGCTEAPRGILYHRYKVDADGLITDAKIVPPTSQNQKTIEADLTRLAPRLADLPLAEATMLAEHMVRNYDPCISCATHFLTLRIERT